MRPMKIRWLCCLLAWLACFEVRAQAPTSLAVLSLVADSMTVVAYRAGTGSNIDANARKTYALGTAALDQAVVAAVYDAALKVLPAAGVTMLAVPKAGAANDPNELLSDLTGGRSAAYFGALREKSVSHLLLVTRYRAPARMQFADGKVGSGFVSGVGFYVDHSLPTQSDGAYSGDGFLAPYAYVRLSLVDLATSKVQRQQVVTASHAVGAGRNREGSDPWNALSSEEKMRLLHQLLVEGVADATSALLKTN